VPERAAICECYPIQWVSWVALLSKALQKLLNRAATEY
jgi:hypothetical protein